MLSGTKVTFPGMMTSISICHVLTMSSSWVSLIISSENYGVILLLEDMNYLSADLTIDRQRSRTPTCNVKRFQYF